MAVGVDDEDTQDASLATLNTYAALASASPMRAVVPSADIATE